MPGPRPSQAVESDLECLTDSGGWPPGARPTPVRPALLRSHEPGRGAGAAERLAGGTVGAGRHTLRVLHVHRAASGDALVAALADLLAEPVGDPFAAEVVAVPAKGVERWLAQRLSHRLGAAGRADGVCARVAFPHPDEVLDAAVAAASPEHRAAVEAWQTERVVWPLLDVLDACPAREQWCTGLRAHLGLDGEALSTRRYAVARRLAGLFTSYAAARPEVLQRWAYGDDTDAPDDLRWQPELWRRLRDRVGVPSPAELLDDACGALHRSPGSVDLPERISLYGVSRVDTTRLRVLAALAAGRDVHLWLHATGPALWDATASTGRRADTHVPVRTPLLASLSRDVRELQLRLAAAAPGHALALHDAPRAAPRTLLQRLQADLHADRVPTERFAVPAGDRSVQVHACHGRARQVEVLREVVLGLLADDPALEPRDVLVLCPDVEAYAPLVAAAFGDEAHPAGRLRVALADRSPRQTNPLLGLAADLLELAAARVTGPQLLDLAGGPAVRLRFGFDDDDLEQLRAWTVSAGVRWGLDAEHRRPWSMHGLAQGTWRSGLDRLLAGVALEESGVLLGDVLPLDDVDSSDVELAGRFAELVDRLDAALHALARPQPLGACLDALEAAVLALGDVPRDGAWQLAQLDRELADVRAAGADSAAPLTLGDLTALLQQRLAGRPTSTSFRTGGLTFCTLTPMRSVPHRVVCLLGLDDGAFPRDAVRDGDDLLARDPHLGERDPRSEDRQLLLDALCAAGDTLVVTYAGSDPRTGAELPPAVPLGELLEALDATARTEDGRPVRNAVVVRHPLQPFDPRNVTPGRLGRPGPLSFDPAALAGARALARPREPEAPFLPDALPRRADPVVELPRLAEFWQHPAKAFLRQRLDVASATRDEEPDDALPVALDDLQQWQVGDRALRARLRGESTEVVCRVEAARGELPPHPLSDALVKCIGSRVDAVVAAAAPFLADEPDAVDVDLALPGGYRLLGAVGGVRGDAVVTVTYSTPRAKHRVRAWVELLALTAQRPERAWSAVVVGRDRDAAQVVRLGPVPPGQACTLLADLVALRDVGLRVPFPLPVGAAEAYARALSAGRPARPAAHREWTSRWDRDREDREPEHVLVWGEEQPVERLLDWRPPPALGEDAAELTFEALVRRVWLPLLAAEGQS